MKRAVTAIGFLLSLSGQISAQEHPPWELDGVTVSDTRLKKYAEGHKVSVLTDSTIQRSGTFLTSLLAFNSNIYFKENGFGMVSSPAFRGTNASHTAVIWNGININSPLNGQVDFNTIDPSNYSSVSIRSGGGGVQYGTGAIGGSVHLNNALRFENHFDHRFGLGYGSFGTKKMNYGQNFGNGRWSHGFGIHYTHSDNDYQYLEPHKPYLSQDSRNRNGELRNVSLNFNAGYALSNNSVLRLYHQGLIGDRNLSGNLVVPGRGRYEDDQYRTQLEWVAWGEKATSRLKLAHLYEGFKYFENKDSGIFSGGKVVTLLMRYSYDVALTKAFRLNSYLEYDQLTGSGSSFKKPQRDQVSVTATIKHSISEKMVYNLGLRKDFSSAFSSPLIFSLDGKYEVASYYDLQLSASRNFRMPTFNDLYWNPGGNLDLVSESSYQLDLGQRLKFGWGSFSINGYYIATDQMIRWLPNSFGIWSPSNVDEVTIYGLEGELAVTQTILRHQNIQVKANYAYTVSQDRTTHEQLIYVPFHRVNASVAYSLSPFDLFYQYLYNGPVSTIGGSLKGYQVANLGITFSPDLEGKFQYRVGVTLNNLFNTYYENVPLRPMPNRNIQTQLLLNF